MYYTLKINIFKKLLTIFSKLYIITIVLAGVAELADALDLGSSSFGVGVQVLFPAPCQNDLVNLSRFFM